MVKTRDVHHILDIDTVDVESWAEHIATKSGLSNDLMPMLKKACDLAERIERKNRRSGKSWNPNVSSFLTGLEMAEILAELGLADEGLVAAVLYRPVREGNLPLETVEKQFGKEVAELISSVLRMAVISTLRNDSEREVFGWDPERQAAKVREMLVSIIDDVRVALIKLAERTCAIRALKSAPAERQQRVAREIFDVYAPLAHRLGIGHLKWELEDLGFRYLEPEEYKRIAHSLAERRSEREHYIEEMIQTLKDELDRVDIRGDVSGRAKHIYSIWRKMQRKGISFSKVYDIRAVRVLVPTVSDCYTLLGIVHSRWRNIPDEFDDYIASPKENGYRSLHTAVIGPRNRVVEIQIRTYEMHEEAEFGICAHWQYKGSDSGTATQSYESKIAWLRQVLEWHDEIGSDDLKDLFKHEGSPELIYVFTPEGHVVDLPPQSTPLDFAYRIHTQVGHRCRGCRINGRIAPLTTALKTADQVEIITGKHESPSRDWLSPSSGYLHTARARAKVQQWFRRQDQEKNTVAGKALLDREFRQLAIRQVDLDELAEKFNKKGREGLYAAIGAGDISIDQVVRAVRSQVVRNIDSVPAVKRRSQATRFGKSQFYIYGVGGLLTRVAKCCNPLPGDDISGFITSGRGVTIHRQDCGSLLRLKNRHPGRVLQVTWGGEPTDVYSVPVRVRAYDRPGLLSDITGTIDRQGLSITSLHSGEKRNDVVDTNIEVEVRSIEELSQLLTRLRNVGNVIDVERVLE
ncbi:MAG: GTP diphosphokinase [Porticoccaceae bacterium]|nr:GTP diphosphokinase [Porticoccaceae bacterium]